MALPMMLFGAVLMFSCSGNESAEENHPHEENHDHSTMQGNNHDSEVENKEGQVVYTCPMHPEVKGKEGEQCPKCGMDLELSE